MCHAAGAPGGYQRLRLRTFLFHTAHDTPNVQHAGPFFGHGEATAETYPARITAVDLYEGGIGKTNASTNKVCISSLRADRRGGGCDTHLPFRKTSRADHLTVDVDFSDFRQEDLAPPLLFSPSWPFDSGSLPLWYSSLLSRLGKRGSCAVSDRGKGKTEAVAPVWVN